MDIKQNLSSGQNQNEVIEQEIKDEKAVAASIIPQLVIRTMANDIAALSKEAGGSASLYAKPTLKPGLTPTPSAASPLKPVVISPFPKVTPPSDLPMYKEEIKPLTPPAPPPPLFRPAPPAAPPVLPKLTPKPVSIPRATTLKQPSHIAAPAPVAAPKIVKPRRQRISLAKLGIIVGVLIVVFFGSGRMVLFWQRQTNFFTHAFCYTQP